MAKATTIKRESWRDSLPKFAVKLDETPIEKRKIFTESNNYRHKKCYAEMIKKLNEVDKNLVPIVGSVGKRLGPLLRLLWKKYEDKLRVHNYELNEEYAYGKYKQGEYGIHINLIRDMNGSNWYMDYGVIFHEFFHNIYNIADHKNINMEQFGNIIINDVQNLLSEEKKANAKEKTRLRTITYDIKIKRDKAALYDIIGAELYRGKYGCNPDNSEFYIGKKCEEKFVCNPVSATNAKIINCKFRNLYKPYFCSNSKECIFKKENGFDYKVKCDVKINYWCDEIFGHSIDYWGQKGPPNFPKLLAEETLVYMATEAIVNNTAYENMKSYLPNSETKFREILMEILNEELEVWRELWKPALQDKVIVP